MLDDTINRRVALGMLGASGLALLAGQQGRISASDSARLQKSEGKTAQELMLELLTSAQEFSRPPISNYRVGAVVSGRSGNLYLGANLEIPGRPLGFSVHAEQSACSNAYMHGEDEIEAIAVTAAPCGHCRQFLQELSPAGELRILVKGQPPVRLSFLLPSAFGPKDLGFDQGALPIRKVNLTLLKPSSDPLSSAALSAGCLSYAPYTKAHSGVAIGLSDGSVHSGAYIENAAFNPSLPPFQAALVSITNTRKSFDQIREIALVEIEHAAIIQEEMLRATMSSICPSARLRKELAKLG